MTEQDADVIVVGARPAGSTVVHHLARAGLDGGSRDVIRVTPRMGGAREGAAGPVAQKGA